MFLNLSVSPRELVVVTVDGQEQSKKEPFNQAMLRFDPGFTGWPDLFVQPLSRPLSLAEAGDLLKMNETFEKTLSARKALASL